MKILISIICLSFLFAGCEPQTSRVQKTISPDTDIVIKIDFSGLAGNSDETPTIVLNDSMRGQSLQLNILSPIDQEFAIVFRGDKFNQKIWCFIPKQQAAGTFEKLLPLGQKYCRQISFEKININQGGYTHSYTVSHRLFLPEQNDFGIPFNKSRVRGMGKGSMPVDICETTLVLKKLAATTILRFNEVDIKTGIVDENKILRVKIITPNSIRCL